MADILVRDVPEEILALLDSFAKRLGISRNEFLKRQISQFAATSDASVTVDDLQNFAQQFGDLADSEVMGRAWN